MSSTIIFERKVEENHARINVLLNVALSLGNFVADADYIPFVDKAGKVNGEIRFFAVHVIKVGQAEIVDKVFAYQALCVFEKCLLFFSSPTATPVPTIREDPLFFACNTGA